MLKFCSLSSSSKGNCQYITDGKTDILIDCGISYARLKSSLSLIGVNIIDIDAVLVTHEHSDHIKGLATLMKKSDIPVFCTSRTYNNIIEKFDSSANLKKLPDNMTIRNLKISYFNTTHDVPSVGYCINSDNKKITVATDLGILTDEVLNAATGSDFVFLESNHDVDMLTKGNYTQKLKKRILSPYGHLSNKMCAEFVCFLAADGTKKFMLGHLSDENNDENLALNTVKSALSLTNLNADVTVAPKDHISQAITL